MKFAITLSLFISLGASAQTIATGASGLGAVGSSTIASPVGTGPQIGSPSVLNNPVGTSPTIGIPSAINTPVGTPTGVGAPVGSSATLAEPLVSPSGVGTRNFNTALPGGSGNSGINNNVAPANTTLPGPSPTGNRVFNQTTTSPIGITQDSPTYGSPSYNSIQSQEEYNSFPDSTTAPGPSSDSGNIDGTGIGTTVNDYTSPIPGP